MVGIAVYCSFSWLQRFCHCILFCFDSLFEEKKKTLFFIDIVLRTSSGFQNGESTDSFCVRDACHYNKCGCIAHV